MTKAQELLELAQQLLDAAHYCTQLEKLEDHCREVARKLETIAEGELPQSSAGLADAVRNYFKLWDRCGGSEAIAADLFAAARQNMRAALADTRPDREGQ